MPHVTIIRPCKGLEPCLDDCLRSSLLQDYPRGKLTVYFCIESCADPAWETIQRVLAQHPDSDAKVFVEQDDSLLCTTGKGAQGLGPNPKIRNMSRAYREAKGDLVWILDCNIWVNPGACGRMVDRICGLSPNGSARPFKFVHHLPVAIDVPIAEGFAYAELEIANSVKSSMQTKKVFHSETTYLGGRLDEAFLSTAHAKMYVAINTVAVAPCICGKSSMFRRSHLNALTNHDESIETRFGSGIDAFSENICEDHLIGDLLWKAPIPSSMSHASKTWRNHGLVYTDIALQPVSAMTLSAYVARRVRWLRVRKFTVPAATLVEPGTEALLCSAMGAFGMMRSPLTERYFHPSIFVFAMLWIGSIVIWATVDLIVYRLLQSRKTIEPSAISGRAKPSFVHTDSRNQRSLPAWLASWFGREALTLPIWMWATWGGATVVWRDKKLWVGFDMKVHEVEETASDGQSQQLLVKGLPHDVQRAGTTSPVRSHTKARRD